MKDSDKKYGIWQFLYEFDMFGAPAPTMNISRETKVRTSAGVVSSILVLLLTFLYALLKLEHMVERKNPSLTTNTTPVEEGEYYKITSDNFMAAFSIINKVTGEPKSDPRYIRWIVKFYKMLNGKATWV